jgi:hypothetical protein
MSQHLSLPEIRAALRTLALEQAKRFQSELDEVIRELEHPQETSPSKSPKKREVIQIQHLNDRIYQLERVCCGESGCKCAGENGKLHGSYWYAYWREDGKLKSCYVGKKLDLNK